MARKGKSPGSAKKRGGGGDAGGSGGGVGGRLGKGGGGGKGTRGDPNMGLTREDFEDEIDDFHKQRDIIPLNADDDFEEDDDNIEADLNAAVMDIKGAEESEEDDEDGFDDDDDFDEDVEADMQLSGLAAKMEKQAKYMRMKLGGVKEDEEDEGEEDEGDEEEGEGALWGQKKRQYYSADNVDYELHMEGETGAQEEEEEALRLQQQIAAGLRVEDYEEEEGEEEGEEEEEEEGEEEGEETMMDKVEKGEGKKSLGKEVGKEGDKGSDKKSGKVLERKGRGAAVVERVVKDVSLLTKEEQMAALMSDAPELVGLLSDLKTTLKELNTKVLPLLQQVREGEYATENGVSYLEAKHGLLLHYCCCLLFFLLLRAEGKPVRDHPVVSRLVELRLFLEKIRPIDKKLQYQIEKLLKLASSANRSAPSGSAAATAAGAGGAGEAGAGGSLDDLRHRPNPNLLVSKLGGAGGGIGGGVGGGEDRGIAAAAAAGADGAGGAGGGVYKPPKIAPMAMDGEAEGGKKGGEVGGRREEREVREARRRAARSAFVKELAEDVEGRPREMRVEGASTMMVEGKEMEREVERLRERAAAEERMFSRVPLNRGEKQRLKALKRSQNMLAGMLDDFDDDIAGIMAAGEEGGAQAGDAVAGAAAGGGSSAQVAGLLDSLLRPRKLSEAIHEAGKMPSLRAQAKVISGDADIPLKPDLGERRRAYEAGVVAKQVRKRGSEDLGFDQGDDEDGGGEGGEEDEFYAEARRMQEARKSAKAAKYSSSGLIPEAEPTVDEDGRRQITTQIERNRGLMAHRNKAVKNPRKKYKLKHANAVVRRKGQVRDVKRETAPYGGESTGIRSSISRSVRIG
ncbi:hypothetical protein CLOM_g12471 [Closterium sp. NIES-68]|nr:hypothetical protein CLOM_g12471 [Closterium sp. NIES-68]